jgi:hypothetical protein
LSQETINALQKQE